MLLAINNMTSSNICYKSLLTIAATKSWTILILKLETNNLLILASTWGIAFGREVADLGFGVGLILAVFSCVEATKIYIIS